MGNSYTDKYEILKTFKKDEFQTVLIGSNKEQPEDVVVINIFNKYKAARFLSKSQFSNGLNNLVHLEEHDNELIVITEYKEGTPLESYLSYSNTTLKHRINLAYEYMTKIVKYDIFQNPVKEILIDESQVNITNDQLYFNELFFLDESVSASTDFNALASKIGNIIEKIVFVNKSTNDKNKDLASKKILNFINKLKNEQHSFNSIQEVYDNFRKIYIYDLFMEDKGMPLNKENKEFKKHENSKKEIHTYKNNLNNEIIGSRKTIHNDDEINIDKNSEVEENYLEKDQSLESIDGLISDAIDNDSKDKDNPIMNSSEIIISNEEFNDDFEIYKKKRYKKKKKSNNFKIAIGAILVSILLVGLLYKPILNTFKSNTESATPKLDAYFEYNRNPSGTYYFEDRSIALGKNNDIVEISWKIYKGDEEIHKVLNKKRLKIKFESEGQYKVVLSVKDKYENTDQYSEIINKNHLELDDLENNENFIEKLENLAINYSSNNISKDYGAFRSGSYSLKLGENGKNNLEKITINNINTKYNPAISIWLATEAKEEIQISLKGYKNDKLQFEDQLSFIPQEVDSWEMVKFNKISKNIDKIEFTFEGFTSPIWLDDIEIISYK